MKVTVLSQVQRILAKETNDIKLSLAEIISKLETGIKPGLPHVKPLSDIHFGLYEIRIKDNKGQFRVIYFIKKKDGIYLIHAFRKKTRKISKKEISVIQKRLKEVVNG